MQLSKVVDVVVRHIPTQCSSCSKALDNCVEQLVSTRQLIDIPPIALQCTAHHLYSKQCSCRHSTKGVFPKYLATPVQYGPNVESLIAYLHTRQYLPYGRTKEFLNDVMGLSICTGGIKNILQRIAHKAITMYDTIK